MTDPRQQPTPEPSGPVGRLRFHDHRTGHHSLLGDSTADGWYEVTASHVEHARWLVSEQLATLELTDGNPNPTTTTDHESSFDDDDQRS